MNKSTTFAVAALVISTGAFAAKPPAAQRNFVACPVVQDTKTVPCWLAEYGGETYYLGIQQDIGAPWLPPQLKHKVLVEGTATSERICGGIVLKPIKTSPLPEISLECNTILPAQDGMEAPHAERGPGPSTVKPGSQPPRARPEPPKPPFLAKEFSVPFDFDNVALATRYAGIIGQAITYARASDARRIEVTSYRGATLLSDGTNYVEKPATAMQRADKIKEILLGTGFTADMISIKASDKPEKSNGVDDFSRRRVTLVVIPGEPKAQQVTSN